MALRSECRVKPREDKGIRLAVEDGINILQKNAPKRKLHPVGRFLHVRFGPKQMGRFDHGLLEGQVLERVQGVVMDENADRALHGEHMRGLCPLQSAASSSGLTQNGSRTANPCAPACGSSSSGADAGFRLLSGHFLHHAYRGAELGIKIPAQDIQNLDQRMVADRIENLIARFPADNDLLGTQDRQVL